MKIAIIGGSGFIGSHTLLELSKTYNDITIIDVIPPKKKFIMNIPHKYIECDICDREKINQIIRDEKFNILYHLSSLIRAEDCRRWPDKACDVNITGLMNVLLSCIDNSNISRLIYSSTTHIYSKTKEERVDESMCIPHDLHLYPGSKLCAESIIMSFNMLYNIPYTILRYSVAVGPYGHRDNVLFTFIKNAQRGEDLCIHNGGIVYRDFMYVSDHTRGNVLALRHEAKNQIINLSTDNIQLKDLAERIILKIKSTSKIKSIDFIRAGDHSTTPIIHRDKAKQLLNWEPIYDIDYIIEQCFYWYDSKSLPDVDISSIVSGVINRNVYPDSPTGLWDSLEGLNVAMHFKSIRGTTPDSFDALYGASSVKSLSKIVNKL